MRLLKLDPSHRRGARRRIPRRARAGVSIIELVVAISLLTIGLLGLASVSAAVLRQMGLSGKQAVATALAGSRFEQFEGRRCTEITNGTATTRGVSEQWTVSGAGLRARAISDSLTFRGFKGKTTTIGMTTVVSCIP